MPNHFNINYELSPTLAWERIDEQILKDGADYVCVADGNILQMVHRDMEYRRVVNGGMFSICDSSWVPLFLRWLYGLRVPQYCGSQIFEDAVRKRKYRMFFMGASNDVLEALKKNLSERYDERISSMQFYELPFCEVEDFDYPAIARMVNEDKPDIIWVSLGAPKQEFFMSKLKPHLNSGVMIAVGAVFKFYSGISEKRAPKWMIRSHLEFVYRLFSEPRKQYQRCSMIIRTLPAILREEISRKRQSFHILKGQKTRKTAKR